MNFQWQKLTLVRVTVKSCCTCAVFRNDDRPWIFILWNYWSVPSVTNLNISSIISLLLRHSLFSLDSRVIDLDSGVRQGSEELVRMRNHREKVVSIQLPETSTSSRQHSPQFTDCNITIQFEHWTHIRLVRYCLI